LWERPDVRRLYIAAFLARIPALSAPLVFTLYVVGELDGTYAQAGIVAAASTVGTAVGMPWRGRLIDRLGMRRAIVPSLVAVTLLFPAAAVAPYLVLVPLAFVLGIFLIPIFSVVRQSLSVMVPPAEQRTAFSADGIVAELSFLVGPAAATVLVTQVGAAWTLGVVGAAELAGGLLLYALDPPTRSGGRDEQPNEPRRPREPWMSVPLFFLFMVSAGTLVALVGTDLSIVASLRELDRVGSIGVVFFFWGLSSLVGGLIYGALPRSIRPSLLMLALGLTIVPVVLADSVWTLALWVLPTGFLCAPTMAASAEWISKLVPENRRGEAMGWQGASFTLGGALGSPVVGLAIDENGAGGGFVAAGLVASTIGVVTILVQLLPRFRVPDRAAETADR
jgi:MFS family permease